MACRLYPKLLAECHRLPNECGNENLQKNVGRTTAIVVLPTKPLITSGAIRLPVEAGADRQAD
jgi:hypothetical protein